MSEYTITLTVEVPESTEPSHRLHKPDKLMGALESFVQKELEMSDAYLTGVSIESDQFSGDVTAALAGA